MYVYIDSGCQKESVSSARAFHTYIYVWDTRITHTQRLPKSAHTHTNRAEIAAAAETATSCQELKAAAKRRECRG